MICGERSIVNEDGRSGIAISLCCRAWNCEHCRPKRRRELLTLAVAGEPNRLITLTTNPALSVSPAGRAKLLANAWRLVVKRAKRAFGWKRLDYLAVFEATKRGEPHLHILARCGYIPQKWLSEQMRQLIGSPICDIRAIKDPKVAARYVAKYIGKAPHRFATCKRYWYTQGWVNGSSDTPKREPWGTSTWQISDRRLGELWVEKGGRHGAAHWVQRTDGSDNHDVLWWGIPPPGVIPFGEDRAPPIAAAPAR